MLILLFVFSLACAQTAATKSQIPLMVSPSPINMRARECLSKIVNAYSKPEEAIIIIARIYFDGEIKITEYPSPIFLITADTLEVPGKYEIHQDIVIVVTSLAIQATLKKIPWNHKSKFVIVPRSELEVPLILRDFWAERIVNVVVMVNGQDFPILTYFPHEESKCSQVALTTQVGICGEFRDNLTHLYPKKLHNMHGCPLKITVLDRPPYITESPTGEIVGIEVEMLKIIAESINATPQFEFFHTKTSTIANQNRAGNRLMLDLTEKHGDIVAGSLMYTQSVSAHSAAVDYFESQCVTFAVPKAIFSIQSFFQASIFFRNWKILALTNFFWVLITPIFWYIFKIQKISEPLRRAMETITAPLYGLSAKIPKKFKSRWIIGLWWLYCFLFWRFLEADVNSNSIAPSALRELETLEDVFNTNIQISGEYFLIKEVLGRYMTQKRKARLAANTWGVFYALREMALYRNISFLGSTANIMHILSQNPQYQNLVHIQKKCTATYSPVIQTEINSPYLEEITKRVHALAEFGIIRKLFQHSFENVQRKIDRQMDQPEFSPLSLGQFGPIFIFLLIGQGFATICFLAELLFFHMKHKAKV